MKENYLVIDGKRIYLTEDQVKALTNAGRQYLFKRNNRQDFFAIDVNGDVSIFTDDFSKYADEIFTAANYCTDEGMMKQRAMHEILNRRLWRYAEEHGGDGCWDIIETHYHIAFDYAAGNFAVLHSETEQDNGTVYFRDEDAARDAINDIIIPFVNQHPDFMW